MNRRKFLALATAASGGFLLDPEKLLWVPGKKTFFFVQQPVRGVSIAQLVAVTFDKVSRERERNVFWRDEALLRELVRQEHDVLARTLDLKPRRLSG